MHIRSTSRHLVAVAVIAVVAFVGADAAAADDTRLEAAEGALVIEAPGKWREQSSDLPIAATGFLGVKRAELFAVVYDDLKDAAGARKRWSEWRTSEGGTPEFAGGSDAERWTASSSASGTVDYARALTGAGRAAVVWVRVSGQLGAARDEATALLDAARLAEPKKPEPAPETTQDPAAQPGTSPPQMGAPFKDPAFRYQISLPEGFTLRKDVKPDTSRAISVSGPVGTDTEAFLDFYVLDDFLRPEAAGTWWQGAERRGWAETLDITGDPSSFLVEVPGETWTRHVRVVETDGGVVALCLDAASQVGPAATALLDAVLASLEVLKSRPAIPTAPPGFKSKADDKTVLQHTFGDGSDQIEAFQFQARVVEDHVTAMLEMPPLAGRKAVLRVYPTDGALANALRPYGIDDGRAAHWAPAENAVLTYATALSSPAGGAALRGELARASIQRRLGFRAPYWLERGIAEIVATAAYEKGRVDVPHPRHLRPAQDAAAQTVEFQTVRWWTHESGVGHPERDAIAWGFAFFFLHGGADGRKWDTSFRGYLKRLRETADPEQAALAFDLGRQVELAEDWKKFMRKL